MGEQDKPLPLVGVRELEHPVGGLDLQLRERVAEERHPFPLMHVAAHRADVNGSQLHVFSGLSGFLGLSVHVSMDLLCLQGVVGGLLGPRFPLDLGNGMVGRVHLLHLERLPGDGHFQVVRRGLNAREFPPRGIFSTVPGHGGLA